MWKRVLPGVAALVLVSSSVVYAQQGPGGLNVSEQHRWRPSAEDIAAFGEARIAALHAGLRLSAEQEKSWPAVEGALRSLIKQRSERFAARASATRPQDPIERLNLRAEAMTQRGAALKKLVDAVGPLYKGLDDQQKHRFMLLARLERPQFGGVRGQQGRPPMGGWMHRSPHGGDGGLQ